MLAITIGTTNFRALAAVGGLLSGEVAYDGVFLYEPDGFTPAMVWDDAIQNVRPRTPAEQAIRDAEIAAAAAEAAQAKADRQELRNNFSQWKDTFQAIRDETNWDNTKRNAALVDLARIGLKIMKIVKDMAIP
jgi:hypothetical protein